jgi:hypothetical protein
VHYDCIDNPRKLCPLCSSIDMEIDDFETPGEQSSSTAQKKRSNKSGDSNEKSSNKKTGGKGMLENLLKN